MSDTGWRRFFAFAAICNFVFGLTLLLDPGLLPAMLPVSPGAWLFERIAGGAVFAFGVGYAMAASDLDRHRGSIVTGAIGKLFVFVICLLYWFNGTLGFGGFLLGLFDLVFAAFFIRFLRLYRARW